MIQKVPNAFSRGRADGINIHSERITICPDPRQRVRILCQKIAFVGGENLLLFSDPCRICRELLVDRLYILHGISALRAGCIHHVDQYFGALYVSQEFMPESRAVRSAFDQSGDIRHDKSIGAVQIHYAQDRVERRKVIVGDPGFGVADHGQKR